MQVTHIVLAKGILSLLEHENWSVHEKGAFLAGTIFPDIRYICPELNRENTHPLPMKATEDECDHFMKEILADISKRKCFDAGVKFHGLVDNLRWRWVQDWQVHKSLGEQNYIWECFKNEYQADSVLKLIEDDNLHLSLTHQEWQEVSAWIRGAIENPNLSQEMIAKYQINHTHWNQWYYTTVDYVEQCTDHNRLKFMKMIGKSVPLECVAEQLVGAGIYFLKTSALIDYTEQLQEGLAGWLAPHMHSVMVFQANQALQPYSGGSLRV